MATFQKVKLGDISVNITDGKHGDCENKNNSGYFFISSKDVFDSSIHYENARQITETDFFDTHRRTRLEAGDVLITNSGTIGRMALIKNDIRVGKTTFQKSVAVIKPKRNCVDNSYLYYKLLSLTKQLINLGGGSAQHNLLLGDLRNFTIQITDFSTQTRIASVLSAYDDLIRNNGKRIKALEEMAQLLYAEWFVKFKFPGHEKVKMVDSDTEYGMIPHNFSVEDVTNLVEFVRGVEPGSANYKTVFSPGLLPFLRVGDLGSRNSELFVEKSVAKGKIIERKDIAVTMDGTVGRVVIGMSGIYSTGIRKLVITNQRINREFLFCFMLSDYIQNIIKAYAKGSTILHASESIKYMKVVLPTKELMDKFERSIKPIVDQILTLQEKNRNLSQTRDLLIPQLVTGKRELK